MREDGGDGEAAGALDVHEEGTGSGHKGLIPSVSQEPTDAWSKADQTSQCSLGGKNRYRESSYLELVLLSLGSRAGVEQINGENLRRDLVSTSA